MLSMLYPHPPLCLPVVQDAAAFRQMQQEQGLAQGGLPHYGQGLGQGGLPSSSYHNQSGQGPGLGPFGYMPGPGPGLNRVSSSDSAMSGWDFTMRTNASHSSQSNNNASLSRRDASSMSRSADHLHLFNSVNR